MYKYTENKKKSSTEKQLKYEPKYNIIFIFIAPLSFSKYRAINMKIPKKELQPKSTQQE